VRDKAWGILLFLLSLLAMAGYFWWLFLAPEEWSILGRSLRDWAVIIPVMLIVYFFLFLILWIGWAMATTPPALPMAKKPEEEGREEPEKEE